MDRIVGSELKVAGFEEQARVVGMLFEALLILGQGAEDLLTRLCHVCKYRPDGDSKQEGMFSDL